MRTVAEQEAYRHERGAAARRVEVVEALGERVAPVTMAHERTLPVPAECEGLFAEGALVRGRVLSCVGTAATSLAMALVAPAVEAGAWLAVVDVPTIGLDAASELGICLERVVGVDLGERPAEVWPDIVAAAADGFELVLTHVPTGVRPAAARSVAARMQQRGVVVIVLGDAGPLRCDGVLESTDGVWEGVGDGFGYLRHRMVRVESSGRRLPGVRRRTVSFHGTVTGRSAGDPGVGDDLVLAV